MTKNKIAIMLVDDDEVDVMSVKRAFRKLKISNPLSVAGNGLEALEVLRTADPRPRIILLDLNMPKMGGLEFLQHVRADPELKNVTVIVLTTSSGDSDRFEAYNLNVAGYIVKPVTGKKFIEAMATFQKYWTLSEIP